MLAGMGRGPVIHSSINYHSNTLSEGHSGVEVGRVDWVTVPWEHGCMNLSQLFMSS